MPQPHGQSGGGTAVLAKLMWAIGQHESGGSYTVVNSSSGAVGKWQVLPSNIPSWTQQALGYSLTPQQFRYSPSAQNKTVAHIMGGYLRQYGVAGTIAAWYGGPGVARDQSSWNNPVPGGPTIRQYVDDILARMGRAPTGVTGKIGLPYRNPFRAVKGLQASRVDMGVDYGGTGNVYALGAGRITAVNQSWAGGLGTGPGTWITERLTAGPLAGKQVYVSEHITPTVKPGQQVTAGTVIGRMFGGIETGIAAPGAAGQAGTTLAQQLGEIPTTGDPGRYPTLAGAAYSNLLRATGAPAGIVTGQPTGAGSGPSWLQRLFQSGVFGLGGVAAGTGSGIAGAINNIANWLQGLDTAINWLIQPSNWVRIVAGVGGGVLVVGGVFALSHTGSTVSVPGGVLPPVRPAALPIGILMVGSGGVLLFVAFHNLPGQPGNVGQLLGTLRDEAQATAAGQQVAA